MKFSVRINKETLYHLSLTLYLLWSGVLIGVKWKASILPVMDLLGVVCMYAMLPLLLYCIFVRKQLSKSYLILSLSMIAIAGITYLSKSDNRILFLVLFVFAANGLNYELIVNKFAKIQLLCILIVLFVYKLGLSEDVISYFSYGVGHSLGTYHANNLGTMVFSCYLAVCYAFLKGRYTSQTVLAIIVAFFLWENTLSRTNCFLVIAYPLAQFFVFLLKKTGKTVLLNSIKQIIVILFGVSVVAALFYEQFSGVLNDGTLIERFRFGSVLLQQYGIHLFGSNIAFVNTVEARLQGVSNLVLDSAYLKLLIYYGVIITLFIIYVFSKSIKRAMLQKDYDLIIVCTLVAISGITQSMMISVYNFALLFAYSSSCNTLIEVENGAVNIK